MLVLNCSTGYATKIGHFLIDSALLTNTDDESKFTICLLNSKYDLPYNCWMHWKWSLLSHKNMSCSWYVQIQKRWGVLSFKNLKKCSANKFLCLLWRSVHSNMGVCNNGYYLFCQIPLLKLLNSHRLVLLHRIYHKVEYRQFETIEI